MLITVWYVNNLVNLLFKIHVPITTSNINNLRNVSDSVILSQLNKQMDEKLELRAQEYGPLLLPGSTFFINSNPRPRRKVNSNNQSYFKKENAEGDLHSLLDTISSNKGLTDLAELEKLTTVFINRRIALNLSQNDVANSFRILYGIHRDGTMISRFERMDLSLSNYLKIYPVIVKWLKDTETADGRDTIIRAVVDAQNGIDDMKPPIKESSQVENLIFSKFSKRRRRTVLPDPIKKELERIYTQNPKVSRYELEELAKKFNIDKGVIQAWFYNRRTRSLLGKRKRAKHRY
ncbi:Transcription factor unc-86 [Schistosoma japonicum]|uniref:SJCHGC01777 protein n=1 Tax=Schistosoma japonicum TaxID=6182 RepID=Q5DEM3_SCHJA|nr:SJCHGC01777 protein [Schistosoma japonicum]KAH8860402.1 Transcription factor unc-86 [Schistosoma japonicum]KAH8860403.1 Transcription factor unc-86 [Schistosoma japonicum]